MKKIEFDKLGRGYILGKDLCIYRQNDTINKLICKVQSFVVTTLGQFYIISTDNTFSTQAFAGNTTWDSVSVLGVTY